MRRQGKLEHGGQAAPLRTCVGCRVRTVKSELLRLVVIEGVIVPDLRGRLPGRGASLHPSLRCLELAERRRAFPRAFRAEGALDVACLRAHLEGLDSE
ncbi:YlxR family protein [Planotetraspora sp. A-T 1434]|uniref:YlxR family protein n=1 Tax=unclassified Planotetraspora TaxID=2620298 RepID=UPI0021C036D3|nr:YlxR family protein [Planotetraspora sp. A-T 1434]MCT9934042.1 YlxR family protein [Planotetraspora sp. A-T 1434]